MTSIFQRALGADFDRLHPRLRQRFGFSADDAARLRRHRRDGPDLARPPATPCRSCTSAPPGNILFPEQRPGVPFTIENYAYRDGVRPGHAHLRPHLRGGARARRRRSTPPWCTRRPRQDRRLPRHPPALRRRLDAAGRRRRRAAHPHRRPAPARPALPGGAGRPGAGARVLDDDADCFRIQVRVTNPRFGPVFGYPGTVHRALPGHQRRRRYRRRCARYGRIRLP